MGQENSDDKGPGTGSCTPRRVEDSILVGRLYTGSAWHKVLAQLLKMLSVGTWENAPGEEHPGAGVMVQVFKKWGRGAVGNSYRDSRIGQAFLYHLPRQLR